MPTSTFPAALAAALRADPSRPLVTFYDDATGERVELSVTTYANWVAKTAALVQDELDGERGQLALVELPTHWLGAVWLGAAWSMGLRVTDDPGRAEEADLVVCGPDTLEGHAEHASRVPVLAVSLRPLGARFAEALPVGVVDYGAVVLGQPDVFAAFDPPRSEDAAWTGPGGELLHSDLMTEFGDPALTAGSRLLTDVNPVSRDGLGTLVEPLVVGGGTVWVRHRDPATWASKQSAERASLTLVADSSGSGQPIRS